MEIKKIFVFLIAAMLISTVPLVLAKTEDTLVISFDPNADIDIDVNNATYNFSTISSDTQEDTVGNWFTLYNNGTIAMDTQINCSNVSGEGGNMTLNESGVAPGTDQYAIEIFDLDSPGWLNQTLSVEFDQALDPNDNKQFDIGLRIGTNISENHSWQTVTIWFQGTASS